MHNKGWNAQQGTVLGIVKDMNTPRASRGGIIRLRTPHDGHLLLSRRLPARACAREYAYHRQRVGEPVNYQLSEVRE